MPELQTRVTLQDQASGQFQRLGANIARFAALASRAFIPILAAGAAGIFAFTRGVEAANEQEAAVAGLNQALLRSGVEAQRSSESLQAYASELQAVTGFGDELILQAQQRFAIFTSDEQQIRDLTSVTLDFAAALGTDLEGASRRVAQAITDKGNPLARYGIEAVGAARSSQRLSSVLEALEENFGGAANAQLNTYGGSVRALGGNFGDLTEQIGMFVTQSATARAAVLGLNAATLATTEVLANYNESVSTSGIRGLERISEQIQEIREQQAILTGDGSLQEFTQRANNLGASVPLLASVSSGINNIGQSLASFSATQDRTRIEGVVTPFQMFSEEIEASVSRVNNELARLGNLSDLAGIEALEMRINSLLDINSEVDGFREAFAETQQIIGNLRATLAERETDADRSIFLGEIRGQLDQLPRVARQRLRETREELNEYADFLDEQFGEGTAAQLQLNITQRITQSEEAEQALMNEGREFAMLFSGAFGDVLGNAIRGDLDGIDSVVQDFGNEVIDNFTSNIASQISGLGGSGGIFGNLFGGGSGGGLGSIFSGLTGGGIGGLFTSIFSAKGNAFENGRLTKYQRGGIVNSPTFFGSASGIGVAGEAGTEAILPLRRDSSGNLGVSSLTSEGSGVAGASQPIVIQQNISVVTTSGQEVAQMANTETLNILGTPEAMRAIQDISLNAVVNDARRPSSAIRSALNG